MGAHCKREKEGEIKQISEKIQSLETLYKHSLNLQLAQDLLEARKSLQQLLVSKAKSFLLFRKKVYYELGDKTGRFLARALKDPISLVISQTSKIKGGP